MSRLEVLLVDKTHVVGCVFAAYLPLIAILTVVILHNDVTGDVIENVTS